MMSIRPFVNVDGDGLIDLDRIEEIAGSVGGIVKDESKSPNLSRFLKL